MAGTTRTRSALDTLFADNSNKAILAQGLRDFLWSAGMIDGSGNHFIPKATGVGMKLVDSDGASNPTFGWKDLLGAVQPRASGGNIPTFAAWNGTIYQYSFGTAGGVTELFHEFHMPHDYLPNSDIFIHSHWSVIAAATGDVNWLYDISYAKGYNQAAFSAPVTVSVAQTVQGTILEHQIAEVQCSAASGVIASAVNVSITSGANILTAASSLFTAADIGRTVRITGAGAAGANLDTTISAYTSATQVTLANNAGTTVTTQPNFKYRVLDTSLLEVDGLIIVRVWRDSARTADTLDQAPFNHYNDMHYQSTQLATKQKNGPNFYT